MLTPNTSHISETGKSAYTLSRVRRFMRNHVAHSSVPGRGYFLIIVSRPIGETLLKYHPINSGFEGTIMNTLRELRWIEGALAAFFVGSPDERNLFEVRFEQADIIRVLDEMPLSTEEPGESNFDGIIKYHFAYRVENSVFWTSQSEIYKILRPKAVHYQFVTLGVCLDVITDEDPRFAKVPRDL